MNFALYLLVQCAKPVVALAVLALVVIAGVKLPWVFATIMFLAGALLVIGFLVELKADFDHKEAVKRHRRRRDESN